MALQPVFMTDSSYYKQLASQLGICVLIPTYNNAKTLGSVLGEALAYCSDIIVVNDGSTDKTADILTLFPQVQVLAYQPNTGKGWALRQGLKRAASQGYHYTITMDSDGQHFAKDLPLFIEKIQQEPHCLLIGARNLQQENVPEKSSFGNRFSNFWFWLFTGIKGPDTQSGYRLYPISKLSNTRFFTSKFEFEIEVLVRAAWKGIPIEWVPVSVYYAPPGERISHFRPFKDFTRISLLNTVLFFIAFLYIKPRNFILGLFSKKKRNQFFDQYIIGTGESPAIKATSIAFGIFMGIVPIWGFQLLVAIPSAIFLKLNKALVVLAANISVPPMIPLIIFASYRFGAIWMGDKALNVSRNSLLSWSLSGQHALQYVIGSITLAVLAGTVAGLFSFLAIKVFASKKSLVH